MGDIAKKLVLAALAALLIGAAVDLARAAAQPALAPAEAHTFAR
jgi:hypothetical protein